MSEPIISAQDVRFSYVTAEGVAPIVLGGVSLDIEKGSFVAVLGHNGSGKSTLAKHMNAILLPTGGKVYVSGMDTSEDQLLLDSPAHRGHGIPEPGQPDRSQRGGGGCGL